MKYWFAMDRNSPNISHERRDFLCNLLKGAALLLFHGCSSPVNQTCRYLAPGALPSPRPSAGNRLSTPEPAQPNTCAVHEVAPMETVPRLAQMYGVPERELMAVNKLKPGEALKPGQKLIIPHPSQYKNIVPVFKNNRWEYIIVHHTAGKKGKALLVDRIHRERGFEEGLGYHFLIDNGSLGKGNGQVEVAPRWIRQEQGAHCKASHMNERAIGIGLVGNFNDRKPSAAQMNTLIQLVALLGSHYEIPTSKVVGHRMVPGAKTDCPGNLFPWQGFQLSLKKVMPPSSMLAKS